VGRGRAKAGLGCQFGWPLHSCGLRGGGLVHVIAHARSAVAGGLLAPGWQGELWRAAQRAGWGAVHGPAAVKPDGTGVCLQGATAGCGASWLLVQAALLWLWECLLLRVQWLQGGWLGL
jgi:hypothetical protein